MTFIIALCIAVPLFVLWHALTRNSPAGRAAADMVRELADELTPAERAREADEERRNHRRRINGTDAVEW